MSCLCIYKYKNEHMLRNTKRLFFPSTKTDIKNNHDAIIRRYRITNVTIFFQVKKYLNSKVKPKV